MSLKSHTLYWSMYRVMVQTGAVVHSVREVVQIFFIHIIVGLEVALHEGYGIECGCHFSRERAWT